MEDFFKNILNKKNDPTDDWDMPDAEVWQGAKQRMYFPKKTAESYWQKIGAAAVFFILIFSGIIWWQNNEIEKLKKELDIEKEKPSIAQIENTKIKKEDVEESGTIDYTENKKAEIEEKIVFQNKIIPKKKSENKHLKPSDSNLFFSEKKGDLSNQIFPASISPTIELPSENNSPAGSAEKHGTGFYGHGELQKIETPHLNKLNHESTLFYKASLPKKITPTKKKRGFFEIGYEYVWMDLNLPSHHSDGKKEEAYLLKNQTKFSSTNGIHIAYSPIRNLYVRAGLRKTNFTIEQELKFVEEYDKTKEYEKPEGGWGNDVTVELDNPYFNRQSDVGIVIPEEAELEDKDLIVLIIDDVQKFEWYQLPLGLDYYFGNKKLQPYINGGGQYNKMIFGEYTFSAELDDKNLSVENKEAEKKDHGTKHFFSAYAGAGLNYQLTDRIHARTGITYNFNFIKKGKAEFSNADLVARAFSLGLNYRL